jgi:hypothetical protein
MHDRNCAVQQAVPTPVTTVKNANDNPDMLPFSDDDSVDSSLYSQDSESEGGIWDNQYNDDVSIAPEGEKLIPPDNDGNKAPAPIQAPEEATCQRCRKAEQYPPAI